MPSGMRRADSPPDPSAERKRLPKRKEKRGLPEGLVDLEKRGG